MNANPCNQNYVSDELTHFVGSKIKSEDNQYELLCEILRFGYLKGGGKNGTGQGNMQIDFSQPLTSNKLVIPETVCFCDIPLKDLNLHMSKFSRFGLAFTKVFMKNRGCNPAYYISMHSPCTDHRYPEGDSKRHVKWGDFFEATFKEWYLKIQGIPPKCLTRIQNLLLWYVLGHVKFFDSTLKEDDPHNYYMEREWRIIGSMLFNIEDVARVILPKGYSQRFKAAFPSLSDRIYEV